MTLTDDQLVEVVREAIDLEVNGQRFYERATAVTRSKTGKKVFRRLAEEEVGHLDEIGRIFTALTGSGDWKKIAERRIAGDAPSTVVEQLEAAIAARGGELESVDEAEALRLAMNMERRAIRLYEGLRDRTPDPKVRALAERLVDEERFHYDLLQAQADSLMNVGIWLDKPEFRMDGKY